MTTSQQPLNRWRESAVNFLALFASTGTLLCCALPIVLVTLGLGSVVVGLTGAAPWLMVLAQQKLWVFLGSALLLLLTGWVLYRRGRSCPADPELARRCERLDVVNRRVFWLSVFLWLLGFTAAYVALPLTRLIEAAGSGT